MDSLCKLLGVARRRAFEERSVLGGRTQLGMCVFYRVNDHLEDELSDAI